MSAPEPSGKDLARQALAAYKTTAKQAPTTKAFGRRNHKKRIRAQYGDGRDPKTLGSVIQQLENEGDLKAGVQGGSLIDRWPELCPELVDKVAPVHFDTATGRLDLQPVSPAFATHLRMLGAQLVTRLQAKGLPVRTIRPLRPGPILQRSAPAAADRLEEHTPEPGPAKTRETASAGYRAALTAHQEHVVTDHGDPELLAAIRAAAARPPALREDEADFTEPAAFRENLEDQAARAADVHRRALQMARRQKAGHGPDLTNAFQRTA
jgi:hypothetical protein